MDFWLVFEIFWLRFDGWYVFGNFVVFVLEVIGDMDVVEVCL